MSRQTFLAPLFIHRHTVFLEFTLFWSLLIASGGQKSNGTPGRHRKASTVETALVRVTRSQRAALPYWCWVPTLRLSWSPCSWRRKRCCCHRSAAYGSANWFLTTPAPPDLRRHRQEDFNRWDVSVGFLQTQMESTGTLWLSWETWCNSAGWRETWQKVPHSYG